MDRIVKNAPIFIDKHIYMWEKDCCFIYLTDKETTTEIYDIYYDSSNFVNSNNKEYYYMNSFNWKIFKFKDDTQDKFDKYVTSHIGNISVDGLMDIIPGSIRNYKITDYMSLDLVSFYLKNFYKNSMVITVNGNGEGETKEINIKCEFILVHLMDLQHMFLLVKETFNIVHVFNYFGGTTIMPKEIHTFLATNNIVAENCEYWFHALKGRISGNNLVDFKYFNSKTDEFIVIQTILNTHRYSWDYIQKIYEKSDNERDDNERAIISELKSNININTFTSIIENYKHMYFQNGNECGIIVLFIISQFLTRKNAGDIVERLEVLLAERNLELMMEFILYMEKNLIDNPSKVLYYSILNSKEELLDEEDIN